MSRFFGRQYKGAMRDLRAQRRDEAETRNTFTAVERTRRYRREAAEKAGTS